MITIGSVNSASGAAEYYAKDNYYAGSIESLGEWYGRGAETLGLTGTVETAAFESVLAGHLPNGAEITTPSGQEHRAGLDITFSAPKSISLLALVGGDQRLVEAIQQSAKATLTWIEANLIEARKFNPSTGHQEPVKTGNLTAALFTHDLSRNRDPQLHVHSVIANAALRPDGQWRAVRNDPLYDRQSVIAAVHNADLRSRVEALGYQTGPAQNPAHGQFELAGVSRAVIEAFSTRSAEIDAVLETAGRGTGTLAERQIAALATRSTKDPGNSRDADRAEWAERATVIGFDPKPLVAEAQARADRGETVWSKMLDGVRGIAARGVAIIEAMGLGQRDRDPLVPERIGRLSPEAFAAAHAVAAGVRHLSQNEAGFHRLDLIRASLCLSGPVNIDGIEARIEQLSARGLLLSDADGRMMTTPSAVALEQQVLDLRKEGDNKGEVLVEKYAGAEAQREAREQGLRRLSPKQEAAAALVLSSHDRVVGIQGVAGAGKSTTLRPVAAIAEKQGRSVVALAVGAEIARKLGDDLMVPSASVAAFVTRHQALLNPDAPAVRQERSMVELKGAVLLVDEASTLSSRQAADLTTIANKAGVAKLALVGDVRQYGAVEAGKPFTDAQKDGLATAYLNENVRAKSAIMRELAPILDSGDVHRAFQILEPVTRQVPRGDAAAHAVALWAQLPKSEREQTLLVASGRSLRAEANREAQEVLKFMGEIGGRGRRVEVLDRVGMTREEARTMAPYREGQFVEIRADMPKQKLARGMSGTITRVEGDKVTIDTGKREVTLHPGKLARNLKEDAVTLYDKRNILLHKHDRIRFTANNHEHGVLNAQTATVAAIKGNDITLTLGEDRQLDLKLDDPAMKRIDLAYAINAYASQGVTTAHGIVIMDSREKMLSSSRTLHVALTRIADQPTLVVDSAPALERAVSRHNADKTSALDIYRQESGYDARLEASLQQSRAEEKARIAPSISPESLRVYPEKHLGPQIRNQPERDIDLSL